MLEGKVRPVIRLSEIERLIKRHRIITPPLSRETLRRMCEEGVLEAAKLGSKNPGWLVYEDSFQAWVGALAAGTQNENAAG
jgi:hypothetical protein